MKFLYNKQHRRTDEYKYKINGSGKHCIKESGEVIITFKDGKYASCILPFNTPYTRNQWRIIGDIKNQIDLIEQSYKNKGK